jgi:hypothetical protein
LPETLLEWKNNFSHLLANQGAQYLANDLFLEET